MLVLGAFFTSLVGRIVNMSTYKWAANWIFPTVKNIIWRIPQNKRTIFLTIDDGPSPQGTCEILQILSELKVRATFFLSGIMIYRNRRYLDALNFEGHQLGNHGFFHHPYMFIPTKMMQKEIELTDKLIFKQFKRRSILFRPPHGIFGPRLENVLNRLNKKLIFWSLMSNDFKWDPQKVLNHLKKNLAPGDIVVFHDSSNHIKTTLQVLPEFLEYCLQNEFEFSVL